MAQTKIRSSKQLAIDANFDVTTHKVVNVVDPTAAQDAATKNYVDAAISGVIAAADAMVFKGTVGTGGTLTITAFNALVVYNAGWTYRVIEAGTIKGKVCEIGDLLISTVDRVSAGVDTDWTVAQTNIDGAVVKADYDANTILAATTDNMPVTLTVTEQTFVGRKTGGNIAALTATEARTILNVADGATNNTKATGAEIDTGTDDVKFATAKAIRDSGLISTIVAGEIAGLTAKTTPVDADVLMIEDSADATVNSKKKLSLANLKTTLATYFNTLYNNYVHPNHSGDVTSAGDGVQTIAANAVTNAKAAQMANSTIKGRITADTGNPEDLTVAQVKTLLGLTSLNLAQRKYRQTPTGTINGTNTGFSITDLVLSGTEEVYLNGILMNGGTGLDYTIVYAATSVITFLGTAIPQTGDVILVSYSI